MRIAFLWMPLGQCLGRPRRAIGMLMLTCLLVLLALQDFCARAEPTPHILIRGKKTIPEVIEAVLRDSEDMEQTTVLVFDSLAFTPGHVLNDPPDCPYSDVSAQLPAWLEAIEKFSLKHGREVYVATTLVPRPIAVGSEGWSGRIEGMVRTPWWESKAGSRWPTALEWIARLLNAVGSTQTRRLVLITSDRLPESPKCISYPDQQQWRDMLCDAGDYWEEEAISNLLQARHATMDFVAPEARFGDFLPLTEYPEVPWVCRPVLVQAGTVDPERLRSSAGEALEGLDMEELVRELAEGLREGRPELSEEEASAEARRMLKGAATDFRSGASRPREKVTRLGRTGLRIKCLPGVPGLNRGERRTFNTDCPSRFGMWPFVRVAARTAGHYYFYPHPHREFLDKFPYDPVLLKALEPETMSRGEFTRLKANDPALHALSVAAGRVQEKTPWTDGMELNGLGRASGWSAFRSFRPLILESRYRERNKPMGYTISEPGFGRQALRTAEMYSKAAKFLAAQEQKLKGDRGVHRRSMADLRLSRFWFAMGAFHLAAVGDFLTGEDAPADSGVFHMEESIRMSDCLAGYEGRVLPKEEVAEILRDCDPSARHLLENLIGVGAVRWRPLSQSNILMLPEENPWYRALRDQENVFRRLNPRLKPYALAMIESASEVMKHEGDSPWGWMVYYSSAFTPIPDESTSSQHSFTPAPSPKRPQDGRPTPDPNPKGEASGQDGGSQAGGER